MEQLKACKFRIYPTEEQEIFFAKSFGCVRKDCLLSRGLRDVYKRQVKNDSSKKMTFPTPAKYKKEFPFLRCV
ncbi:transposase [Enterococcus faecium]|nr:transposase [Enterococcus faecium]